MLLLPPYYVHRIDALEASVSMSYLYEGAPYHVDSAPHCRITCIQLLIAGPLDIRDQGPAGCSALRQDRPLIAARPQCHPN